MLDLILTGGLVVTLAGVLQARSRRRFQSASTVSLLREGLVGLEGADAQALRAEFRRSGIALPKRQRRDEVA